MKNKLLALILAGCMLLPMGASAAADSCTQETTIASEKNGDVSAENKSPVLTEDTQNQEQQNNEETGSGETGDMEQISPEESDTDTGEKTEEGFFEESADESADESLEEDFAEEITDPGEAAADESTEGFESEEEYGGIQGLSAETEDMEMIISLPETEFLPEGTVLTLYTGEELKTYYDASGIYSDYLSLVSSLEEEWNKNYPEMETALLYPFAFSVTDSSGGTVMIPKGSQVSMTLKNAEIYASVSDNTDSWFCAARKTEDGFALNENTEVRIDKDNQAVRTVTDAVEAGLYVFVQKAEVDEEIMELTQEDGIMMAAAEDYAKGSPISGVSGWTKVTTGTQLDSNYLPVRWYSGRSSYQLIGAAESGKWKLLNINNTTDAWLPLGANAQKTEHGARYNKVIYDYKTGSWYDMKLTVATCKSGGKGTYEGKSVTYYPYVGFQRGTVALNFYRFGELWLKIKILKNGTDEEAKVNVRLAIWDIDACQFVSFKPGNAKGKTFVHRYYYPGTLLSAKNYFNSDGSLNYSYVEGPEAGSEPRDIENLAVWDVEAVSNFQMSMGFYNTEGISKDLLAKLYAELTKNTGAPIYYDYDEKGATPTSTILAMVGISAEVPNPPTLTNPVKRVSNIQDSGYGSSNTLASVSDAFWYEVISNVPDVAANLHYYSSMQMEDQLPEGVEYTGNLSVVRMETGEDVTSLFDNSETTGDRILLKAKNGTLSKAGFYGYAYRVRFQVKMNTSKIIPKLSYDAKTYTVNNEASVIVNRGGLTYTNKTEKVQTTAPVTMTGSVTVTKKIAEKDIVWAHGDPVFRFVLEGKDSKGSEHSYEDYVVFQKVNYKTEDGYAALSVTFQNVPIGTYTIREKSTLRYKTGSILAGSGNASINGDYGTAQLTMDHPDASFIFTNRKTDFSGLSHTDVIRNSVAVSAA